MYFTYNEHSTPRTIEKIKILGAVLELPAEQDFDFLKLSWVPIIHA